MIFFAVLYRYSDDYDMFIIGLVLVCIYTAYQFPRKFFKRLKANGWKYVPLPKWRGNYEEVYAFLADNGLQDAGYSPSRRTATTDRASILDTRNAD